MGISDRPGAVVDPLDQPDAASACEVGCHGILVEELQETPEMGLAQTVITTAAEDGYCRCNCGHAGSMGPTEHLVYSMGRSGDPSLRRSG